MGLKGVVLDKWMSNYKEQEKLVETKGEKDGHYVSLWRLL